MGGDDEEGFGQAVGFAVYGHLFFFHGFQQGGLHFGRGAVDFVGQQEVVENGAGVEFELAVGRLEHVDAEEVGGKHIVGALDAAVAESEHGGQAVGEGGFAHAGHVFEQNVAVGQDAGHQVLENGFFAENQAVELGEDVL